MNRQMTLIGSRVSPLADRNRNGIADALEPPEIDVTEGHRELEQRLRLNAHSSPILSGGDIDAEWESSESSGEETVGGSNPTPDQNVVEDLGKALGVNYRDDEILSVGSKEHRRDIYRWELDPASAEDYDERRYRLPS